MAATELKPYDGKHRLKRLKIRIQTEKLKR